MSDKTINMVHKESSDLIEIDNFDEYDDLDSETYYTLKQQGYLEIPDGADLLTNESTFYKEVDGELFYMYMEWNDPDWVKCKGKLEDFHDWEIVWERKGLGD